MTQFLTNSFIFSLSQEHLYYIIVGDGVKTFLAIFTIVHMWRGKLKSQNLTRAS